VRGGGFVQERCSLWRVFGLEKVCFAALQLKRVVLLQFCVREVFVLEACRRSYS
jgi:hypothetical protein